MARDYFRLMIDCATSANFLLQDSLAGCAPRSSSSVRMIGSALATWTNVSGSAAVAPSRAGKWQGAKRQLKRICP